MKNIKELVEERAKTHGDFSDTARVAQGMRATWNVDSAKFTDVQLEALVMISQKIARIVTGDPNNPDNYQDIQGYCQLVLDRITPKDDVKLPTPTFYLYHGKESTVISFQTPDKVKAVNQAVFESILANGHWVVLRWYDGQHSHREEYLNGKLEKEWHDV